MSFCGDLKVWVSFLCSQLFLHGGGQQWLVALSVCAMYSFHWYRWLN